MRVIFALAAAALLLSTPFAAAQDARFTAEQQAMIDSLPPAQRAELMRQVDEFQRNQQASDPAAALARTRASQTTTPDAASRPGAADPAVIRPGDTLIIEVTFPPVDPSAASASPLTTVPRTHLLLGKHTVELDRLGRLDMPGLADIPLAGLNAEQAELRLLAEPILNEMEVAVTRLPLVAVGRDALQPFGYDIFKRPVDDILLFQQPTMERGPGPVPSDYRIGPGDELHIFLYGKESETHQLRVTNDGTLQIPTLGPVPVAGLQFSAAKDLIERRVREETIGTQAAVSMGALRQIEVLVIGEVVKPGLFTVSSLATVITALYEAEGVNAIGSLRDIRVLRNGEQHARFDLYDLLLEGDARGDLRLDTGDVVFVPSTGPRAGVMGEVLRPAWFEMGDEPTLAELLKHAGGAAARADLRRVQVQRRGADGLLQFVDVDATTDAGRALAIEPFDVVRVPPMSETAADAIVLRGHFELGGARQWEPGLRVADLLSRPGTLRPNPDLDYALVVRELDSGRGIGIEMFSPRAVLADPASPDNLELQARDQVYVFGFDEPVARRALVGPLVERLRRQAVRDDGARIAQVTGAVRAPGMYPLADGMRLADLTRAGGGLDESAYAESAEVTRYDSGNGTKREIEHIEVDLARVMAGEPDANLLVQSHDVLNVKQVPQWTERGTIELRGEVRFPGTYPIRPGETLSQIIERAGGLTEFAYPMGAVFTRESLREREQEQIEHMVRRLEADVAAAVGQGGAAGAQAQALGGSMIAQLRSTRAAGRLVIDLPRLLEAKGDPHLDVLAADGDLLAIPPRPQEVTVLGEVNFATSHVYLPDAGRDDYIERSGGTTYRADKGRIYIVRANGAVEAAGGRRDRTEVMPGDTIVVPLDAERLPTMVRIMNISQVIYQIAIAAAAWNALGVL